MSFASNPSGLSLDQEEVLALFDQGGNLSQTTPHYEERIEQKGMLCDVLEAYNSSKIALIEAGTGTGKSWAYLIPALLWAHKNREITVISTNTIALQEQLMMKDIPKLLEALDIPLKVVLAKGMNNYLCLRKLEDAESERSLFTLKESEEIEQISIWARSTKEGSKSELPFMPSYETWEKVGAEGEACNHLKCPHYKDCFFFKARKELQDANLIIVNHHLLFADLSLRAERENSNETVILPSYHHLIIDEAHHLEEVATHYFADKVSRLTFHRLFQRLYIEKKGEPGGKIPLLRKKMLEKVELEKISLEAQKALQRIDLEIPSLKREAQKSIETFFIACEELFSIFYHAAEDETERGESKLRILSNHREHPFWTSTLQPLLKEAIHHMQRFTSTVDLLDREIEEWSDEAAKEKLSGVRLDIRAPLKQFETVCSILGDFFSQSDDIDTVSWIEAQSMRGALNLSFIKAKLNISEVLSNELFSRFQSLVLCSATLTTQKNFLFLRGRWGLEREKHLQRLIEKSYSSPFNYKEQVLLTVPTDLPDPSHKDYLLGIVNCIWDLIHASQGNAFILFTSYGMLKSCFELLAPRLIESRYQLYRQGAESRSTLLNKFRQGKRGILFGTDSFWEGVDVVGDALRCVIIAKLPFKVPSEPLNQARSEHLLREGKDPFMDYAIPQAIMKFKQGFGRLIRSKQDRGCVVCLDGRIIKKGYGKLFLKSLPPCKELFDHKDLVKAKMEEFYRKKI